jgi:hypothetical protein
MALPMFEQPLTPHFFAQARQKLLAHFSISSYAPPLQPGEKRIPKVIYIDRQNSDRKLKDEDHEGLEELLRDMHKMGVLDFDDVVLEDHSKGEQVEKVAGADVGRPRLLAFDARYLSVRADSHIDNDRHSREWPDAPNVDA